MQTLDNNSHISYFEYVGGLLSTLNDEFNDTNINLKLTDLSKKWETWVDELKKAEIIQPLPFTQVELEYLNSPLLDELTRLEHIINLIDNTSQTLKDKWNQYFHIPSPCNFQVFNNTELEILQDIGLFIRYRVGLDTFNIVRPFSSSNTRSVSYLRKLMCLHGYEHVIKFIHNLFPDKFDNLSFIYICSSSCFRKMSIAFIQWFHENCVDVSTMTIKYISKILEQTCRFGNLQLAKYLYSKYPDIIYDKPAYKISGYDYDLVVWLFDTFPHMLSKINDMFYTYRTTLRMLLTLYEYKEHIKLDMDKMYHSFTDDMYNERFDIAGWLITTFPELEQRLLNDKSHKYTYKDILKLLEMKKNYSQTTGQN